MVGQLPLEQFILVRVQIPQQFSLVRKDLEGSNSPESIPKKIYPLSAVFRQKSRLFLGDFSVMWNCLPLLIQVVLHGLD